ncbi:hypothetical protein [Paludibacterium denitrificans]|uniref:Uncharacterized protein n=1 Tax=Paludibacterium denitrificans TaxID=2675226 RepID=A0A844GEH8_9NEIS|nr:hypothetical protein [Paludibacterium denitrificans]MTD33134.1 hypothetical protein [Paludibacterium denitrificans]
MHAKEILLLPLRLLYTLTKWLLIGIFGIVLLGVSAYGMYRMLSMWTYETDLMEHDKPYGGGDMRIRGRQVMVFKPIGPELKFKPTAQLKDPEVAEFTEPWMNDTNEELNRYTIRLLRGDMDQGIRRIFEKPGQDGASVVVAGLADPLRQYRVDQLSPPPGPDGYGQRWTSLWKSTDGGQHWQKLPGLTVSLRVSPCSCPMASAASWWRMACASGAPLMAVTIGKPSYCQPGRINS